MARKHEGPAFDKGLLRRIETWLAHEDETGEPVAAEVASLDFVPAAVDVFLRMHPDGLTVGIARQLTTKAHAQITRNPPKAVALALLAARIAEAATSPLEFVAALDTTRGEAWMRYAAAVLETGNFAKAWEASERADTYFQLASPYPRAFRSEATLGLTQGKILHFLGKTDEGLLRIEQSANLILAVFQEPDKYVEAVTLYNGILMHAGRFAEAAQRWEEIGGLVREEGDNVTLAIIVNNIGRCYLELDRLPEAQECFETALEMFEKLGHKTRVPDTRLNLAFALRKTGRYGEALFEMYRCRSEFEKFGMKFDAAQVCIRIVETRMLAHRDDELQQVCQEAVEFFRAAGLPEQAERAADYLLESARTNTLQLEKVREVGNFLSRLRDFPEERFRHAV
jgi:tetratricopeptide (TPR) repeat protein